MFGYSFNLNHNPSVHAANLHSNGLTLSYPVSG